MPSTRKTKAVKDHGDAEQNDVTEEKPSTKFVEQPPSQWMFFVNEEAVKQDPNFDNQPVIVALRHPRTDKKALYLFSHENQCVYEVNHFKEEFRSWLIGDTVHHDGSLYISTEVDPVFLVLPYLVKASQSGKFMTLDQIITDDDYPECNRLVSSCEKCDLELVSDVKGDVDLRAYKYNHDKTLSWLKVKTERVSDALSERSIHVLGAKAEELIQSKASEEEYLRYAHGVVSDYLSVDLASSLREHLGLPAAVEKRPSDAKNPPSKRVKLEDITPEEDYSKNARPEPKSNKGKQSNAQKKLEKVDKTGMKSMMSFFSPKSKS